MTTILDNQRKAAIVLASLEADAADALIEQMPEDEAAAVRAWMMDLDEVDPVEREAAIDEFLRLGFGGEATDDSGVEVEANLAEALSLDATAGNEPDDDSPFAFLGREETWRIVQYVEDEHPQTIALVLAHLPPDRAGEVLADLPAAIQADVLGRLERLGEPDPHVVREVEQGLSLRLRRSDSGSGRLRGGPGVVAAILECSREDVRKEILSNLVEHEPKLARGFSPPEPAYTFEDLARLDDLALAKVAAAADPDVLRLALAAARPSFVQRMLDQLPRRAAKHLRQALDRLGPTRLADVERAQQQLLAVASRLVAAGRIELPREAICLTM